MIEYRANTRHTMVSIFMGGNRGNIIYAPGLPQYIDKNHPFVQQAVRLGYNLFVPRYPGTYEGDGRLSIFGCARAIDETCDMVSTGQTIELFSGKKISWHTDKNLVVGFSFGGLPALLAKNKFGFKTVLVCPFVSLAFHEGDAQGENLAMTLDYLKRAYPNTYRFDKDAFLNGIRSAKLPASIKKMAIVVAEDDESIPKTEMDFLKDKYSCSIISKPGHHSISMSDKLFTSLWLNS